MIYTCAKIKCEGGVNNFQSVVIFCFERLYTNLCIFSLVRAVPLLILSHPPIHLHQQNERVLSKHSGMVLQPHSSSPVTAFTIYCFSRPVSVL